MKPSRDRPALSPRERALERLLVQSRRYPQLGLEAVDASGLSLRDAALLRAIDHAAARHWLALEALVCSRLDRPWERIQHEVRAALLGGAAQLFYMDGAPDHAVVDATVGWAARRAGRRSAGFINAVLRSLIRLRGERLEVSEGPGNSDVRTVLPRNALLREDGSVLALTEDVFAEDRFSRLAQQTSHPTELLSAWRAQHGEQAAARLALHSIMIPPLIVTGGVEPLAANPALGPHREPGFHVFVGDHDALRGFLAADPLGRRVQDPTSAAAVELTRGTAARRIADVCAGRGTKTVQLAAMHPEAEIVASDIDPARRRVLRERLREHSGVTVIEPAQWIDYAGGCDLIVLDVPCSNTGVLARRVEAKLRFSAATLRELVALQRQIVADALRLRAADGYVLYSTCSLERSENEAQVQWIERYHPLRACERRFTMPRGVPGDPPGEYCDGGFAALLQAGGSGG